MTTGLSRRDALTPAPQPLGECSNEDPVIAAALALLAAPAAGAADCNRACLRDVITQYLEAMVRHDPSQLPLASKVRFTEDQQELKLGEGLWKSIDSLTGYRQDILDVKQGIAGVHVKVIENGKPVLAAIRIQMDGRKICRGRELAGAFP